MKGFPAPLSHIKVLDLSRVLAGPWASQLLSDLGATVIKVEHPRKGDDTRKWGPPFFKNPGGPETSESAYYLCANRGKKSIGIDFSKKEGQDLIHQLVKNCDVLIENFRVGALSKFRLSYQDLAKLNPQLIYCSITGFGQKGPYKDFPGYDYMIQAMGGLMSITGLGDEEEGGGPMRVGVPIVDLMTGMYATVAIQGALMARDKIQQGQFIDLSLWDVQLNLLANQGMNYLVSGEVPQRLGHAHPNIVPYQVFKSLDQNILIAVGNDEQFKKLCQVLNCGGLAGDKRFTTNQKRVERRKEIIPLLQEKIQEKTSAHWLKELMEQDIPCGPINNLQDVFSHPQTEFRQMKFSLPHALGGEVPMVANPIHYSKTPLSYQVAPPFLGQHSQEILENELGLSQKIIEEYRQKEIVG